MTPSKTLNLQKINQPSGKREKEDIKEIQQQLKKENKIPFLKLQEMPLT
jgi:hypothetical protein